MTSVACVFVLLTAFPALGQAQPDTTGRTITIPVPDEGIIYIRSGPPGGVRIRSLRTAQGRRVDTGGDDLERPDVAAVDLERLARVFDRQGLDLDAEYVRSGGRDVIVLRDANTGQAADTLSVAEAAELVESFADEALRGEDIDGAVAAGDDGGVSDGLNEVRPDSSLVAVVERLMLDKGVFRSLQVNFEFDRSELLPSSRPTIEAVADVLNRYPDLQVEVAGHTDSIGTASYNQALSERRAARVADDLTALGIDADRLRATGYGETRPILSNDSPTGRVLNRRVEFRVLDGAAVDVQD
ncbi:MAG: OmpA family protein [Rhodothermales bacterium]